MNIFTEIKFISKFLTLWLGWLLVLYMVTLGCANIQPPLGGPKDSLPPVLIQASPMENAVNFKEKTIRLRFDEYIRLENLNENLIINPPANQYPSISGKLKVVTIKIKDTLAPNTTYTYNFGKTIVDVNENNPIKNFSYAFSTGSYIDSLTLSGKIINAETGLADSSLTIILHTKNDDSTVAKEKPKYATKAQGGGVFHFDHLPKDSFYIYALKDAGTKQYSSNSIPFAFFNRKVEAGETDSIELRFFVGEVEPEKKRPSSTTTSTERSSKTGSENADKKLKYTVSAQGGQNLLEPLTISFSHPIRSFDSTKIILTDTLDTPITNYYFTKDSTGKSLTITTAWRENFNYRLYLDKGFASDSAGASITKKDTIAFKSKAESEYGQVKLKFNQLDFSKHPVLQWMDNDKIFLSVPLTQGLFVSKLFQPGQYKIRILYDDNQNGIWDTGNFWKKIQPEYVLALENPFAIKANWENEFDVNL